MRRTKEEAAATREKVLDAALRVFGQKGYAATRLEDVAAEAGLTRGAVYWHFEGKAELYTALVGERMAKVSERYAGALAAAKGRRASRAGGRAPGGVRGGAAGASGVRGDVAGGACEGGGGSAVETLRTLLLGSLEPLVDDPEYRALVELMWLKTERLPELEAGFRQKAAALRGMVDAIAELMARGVASGELDPSLDARVAALTTVGLLNGLTGLYLMSPALVGSKAGLRAAVEAHLRGLRALPRVRTALPGAPQGGPAWARFLTYIQECLYMRGVTMVRNAWYIACASARLGAGPVSTRVLDRDLVLFRDGKGLPRALLDRCAHRGVKLSLGRAAGGQIACGYHGFRFDGGGACTRAPSLGPGRRLPASCSVPSFACVEQDGYVWVWAGEGGEPLPVPSIEGFGEGRWLQGSMTMGCDYTKALENGVDWCHPAFAHPWSHAQFYSARLLGLREQRLELRATADGLEVRGPSGVGRGGVTLAFRLPCRVDIIGPGPRRIITHAVPTGQGSCRLEWLMPRVWPFGPQVRWVEREGAIFRQDRLLLESSMPAYADAWRETSVEADAPGLLLRRILAAAERGEWGEERAATVAPRHVVVRA